MRRNLEQLKALTQAFGRQLILKIFRMRSWKTEKLRYAQWRSTQVQPTDTLKALIPRLEAVGAFDKAKYLGSAKGISLSERFFTSGQNREYPTAATWDLVKRGLDSKIEQALSGGNKTRASALLGLKDELITKIGKTEAGQVWNQAR